MTELALVVLFSAPWLVAIAWFAVRHGMHAVAPGNADVLPSAAEAIRRRMAVR